MPALPYALPRHQTRPAGPPASSLRPEATRWRGRKRRRLRPWSGSRSPFRRRKTSPCQQARPTSLALSPVCRPLSSLGRLRLGRLHFGTARATDAHSADYPPQQRAKRSRFAAAAQPRNQCVISRRPPLVPWLGHSGFCTLWRCDRRVYDDFMATWEDGPEYAPIERPAEFQNPDAPPLETAPTYMQVAAWAPKSRPLFDNPSAPLTPLSGLVPAQREEIRDPQKPFTVVSSMMTSDSAWGAVHWAPPSGRSVGPNSGGGWSPTTAASLSAARPAHRSSPGEQSRGSVPNTGYAWLVCAGRIRSTAPAGCPSNGEECPRCRDARVCACA